MIHCSICQKEFKRITKTHLKHHNITIQDYKKLFPESPIMTEELRHSYGKFFRENNPMKTIEVKQHFSLLFRGRHFSESTRKKLSEAKSGKKLGPKSEESKKKIGQSNKRTRMEKIKNGWQPPKYQMSEEARKRARVRMLGNTLGRHRSHNKGKPLNLSEEQRQNRSKKRVEYLSNNKNIKSGTKPEKQFIEFLTQHNIKYCHQYPIHTSNGSWLYDFYLPEFDLFVEIDGEYWHSKKQSICRDEIKNSLVKEKGKVLARISTNDLDFSVIFLDAESIWSKNYKIISERKI